MLPKFPDVKNLKHLGSIPMEKLHTFMVMYRAHCQRILDSVVRANFDEVSWKVVFRAGGEGLIFMFVCFHKSNSKGVWSKSSRA